MSASTTVWVTIALLALTTAAIKAIGTALVGGRDPPERVAGVISMLAPALLTALVITGTFAEEGRLVLDARAVGVGVAGVALWLRVPMLLALALAAVVTAVVRAL